MILMNAISPLRASDTIGTIHVCVCLFVFLFSLSVWKEEKCAVCVGFLRAHAAYIQQFSKKKNSDQLNHGLIF